VATQSSFGPVKRGPSGGKECGTDPPFQFEEANGCGRGGLDFAGSTAMLFNGLIVL
jgi:hypothetical protein